MFTSETFSARVTKTLSVPRVSHAIDHVEVSFDDSNLVANAGLLLVGTVSDRLGLEAMIDARCALAVVSAVLGRGARC